MGWWFYLSPVRHFESHLFMLQGVAALKLKENLYFLILLAYTPNLTNTYFCYELNLFHTKTG